MVRKQPIQIPFDPISGELLPESYIPNQKFDATLAKYIPNPSYGMEIDYRDNFVFHAKMKIEALTSSYSSSPKIVVSEVGSGARFCMYSNAFNNIIDRIQAGGILDLDWTFCKNGNKISIKAVL